MNAGFAALLLALAALVLWLLAQLFDNLALNVPDLDDRLARINTASFLARTSGWLIAVSGVCALIGLLK